MTNLNSDIIYLLLGIFLAILTAQLCFTLYLFRFLKLARAERTSLYTDLFGLVRKIEGQTSSKREQMLKHYDSILEDLNKRLPPVVAAKAGEVIFEAESQILSRLAELEPNIKDDEASQKKMDQIIKSMENLEHTVVSLTADTVESVFTDSRKSLFDQTEVIVLDRPLNGKMSGLSHSQ